MVVENGSSASAAAASNVAAPAAPVPTDVLEERLIDEEYKIWKKNTPYLYDYVMTHSLEWPSLTCQWLPHTKAVASTGGKTTEEHSLLLGTHTTGEQNYLMVATCNLPKTHNSEANDENNGTKNNKLGAGSVAAAAPKKAPAMEYDEEKDEFGGFVGSADVGKIDIKMKVMHEGEVNRARYMPQNHFMVASRGPNPEVYIWDLTKHSSFPDEHSVFRPQGLCVGHTKEGYGMVWSTFQEGHLATASEDCTVRLWDISTMGKEAGQQISSYATLSHHTDTVEDVDWHFKDPNLIVSVGGDRSICLWDKTNPTKPHFVVNDAHLADINSVAFNPLNEYIFATGSSDRTIGIWDVRKLNKKMQLLENVHTDDVFTIQWAPHDEAILASCSADRRVAIWDLSRTNQEQSPEDAQDGPPELLFLHGGHTSKVSDLGWNPNNNFTMASTSEDNIFQVWSMAEEIYATGGTGTISGLDENGERVGLGPDELE